MQHSEFTIGGTFWCSGRQWRCTDIGTRTIAAIRVVSPGEGVVQNIADRADALIAVDLVTIPDAATGFGHDGLHAQQGGHLPRLEDALGSRREQEPAVVDVESIP
jgi:hypothetical protein